MFLKYGSYTHSANEVSVAISRTPRYDEHDRILSMIERWEIDGRLAADTQAALTTAINALEAAYETQGQNVGLYLDDGTTLTSHAITSADTIGGVRVVEGPSYPDGRGAEYSTFRNYRIALEAETDIAPGNTLLFWEERIETTGGGGRFVMLQTLTGSPQKQIVAQATPYRAIQSGRAVGYGAYPLPASPLWPASEHVDQRQVGRRSPRRRGPTGQASYEEWEVVWSYSFEDVAPLIGFPSTA